MSGRNKTAVIVLDNNLIIEALEENNHRKLNRAASLLLPLFAEGWELVIIPPGYTNGKKSSSANNGKDILLANHRSLPEYLLQQTLGNKLFFKKMNKHVLTVITRVLVEKKKDKGRAIANKVKPVLLSPVKVIEKDLIEYLLERGHVVIALGGGGIPVIDSKGGYQQVAGLIDVNHAASLLAKDLEAELFIIITSSEKIFLKPDKPLEYMGLAEAKQYLQEGEFSGSNLGSKIGAAVDFIETTAKKALFTSLEMLPEAILGRTGTIIG